MKVYESLRQFTKVTIFHDIFLVKSLAFVPFRSLAMQFLYFVILYDDERNFPVCYRSILPLDNIGKYFAIAIVQVFHPISQILSRISQKRLKKEACMMQIPENLLPPEARVWAAGSILNFCQVLLTQTVRDHWGQCYKTFLSVIYGFS